MPTKLEACGEVEVTWMYRHPRRQGSLAKNDKWHSPWWPMLILKRVSLEYYVEKDSEAAPRTVGKIASLLALIAWAQGRGERMQWPSLDSVERLELGEWHNSWFQELLLWGAEPHPEVKMKKNGLHFMPEWAGLVQDCSGQLRTALIWDTCSTQQDTENVTHTITKMKWKEMCLREGLGSLGSPHIPQVPSSWLPDQLQTPLISGAEHFNMMAACSDVHVRQGLSGRAVLPRTGINKHWHPVCIFKLGKHNGLPASRFILLHFIITHAARIFSLKCTLFPGSPLLRFFNDSSSSMAQNLSSLAWHGGTSIIYIFCLLLQPDKCPCLAGDHGSCWMVFANSVIYAGGLCVTWYPLSLYRDWRLKLAMQVTSHVTKPQ